MIESRFDPARVIAGEIQTILSEQSVETQAVILAQLTGAFLAGHVVEGDHHATMVMRISILHALVDAASALSASADEHRVAGHA